MRQNFFEFTPTHKLLVVGNSMPFMREVGAAEARRLRFVPFSYKPPRPNLDLLEQLKGEWPGVLYWALEGCFSWQEEGMHPPKIVEDATCSYVTAMDHFGEFFKECLVDARKVDLGEEQFVPTADLRGLYIAWCIRDEVEERSTEWLGKQMRKRGFVADRRSCKPRSKVHGQHRVWLGVAVAKEAKLRAA
jgi:putative DNA primase/helicase